MQIKAQKGMTTTQLKELNQSLENYKKTSPEQQIRVRRDVIREVKFQRDQFKKKLLDCQAELKNLNLILGATGAGKSTLFNFLNGLPLIIKEGVDQNKKKNQTIRLDVDFNNVPAGTKYAPIGHGFVSQTTIPNFAKSKFSDVTYVDCAGQFDSRDILQSIINSYFKYQLAGEAKKVKLTIAINYNDIRTNRGTIFKQILKEVGNFIGLWEEFRQNNSISLVITGADPTVEDVKGQVIQMIKEIAEVVKDLGPFKEILADIAGRGAVAIFLAPKKKCKTVEVDGQEEQIFYIPDGEQYKPKASVCSPKLISETLQQTKFMPCKPGLFVHNLQSNAQYIVNVLCEGIIQEIKTQVMSVIVLSLLSESKEPGKTQMAQLTIDKMNSQKTIILEKISKLSAIKDISQIITIFEVKKQRLFKYSALDQDLNQFLKISNIPNIKQKIAEVSKDIILYLREKVMNFDKETIDFMNKSCQKSIQQNKKLQQQLASKKYEAQAIVKAAQVQAKSKKQENQYALRMKQIQLKNQLKIAKQQEKTALKKQEINIQKEMNKNNQQMEKQRIELESKKIQSQKQIHLQEKQMELQYIKIQNDRQQKRQQNTFGNKVIGLVEKVLEVPIAIGKNILEAKVGKI